VNSAAAPEFRVFSGKDVRAVIDSEHAAIIRAVESAYRAHHHGRTVNPPSTFVRFPDNSSDRIIALPASYQADVAGEPRRITGIKWIASFPGNVANGIPRASAVLILNDERSGFPFACIEASAISSARTAASAASALTHLLGSEKPQPCTLAVIGAGEISRQIIRFLFQTTIPITSISIFDLVPGRAVSLCERVRASTSARVIAARSVTDAIRQADVVVFATTATEPHVFDPALFQHNPIVLHISLRDLAPEVILSAHNVVDDADHCLSARTSLHLTELQVGHREFVTTTLPEILCHARTPERNRPIIFSPFGLGVLDLAVGVLVYSSLRDRTEPVPDFFACGIYGRGLR